MERGATAPIGMASAFRRTTAFFSLQRRTETPRHIKTESKRYPLLRAITPALFDEHCVKKKPTASPSVTLENAKGIQRFTACSTKTAAGSELNAIPSWLRRLGFPSRRYRNLRRRAARRHDPRVFPPCAAFVAPVRRSISRSSGGSRPPLRSPA